MPLAIGLGEGSEVQAPMARVVVGGLVTSTFITLFRVPVVYSTLAEWQLRRAAAKEQQELAGAEPAFADE